MTERRTLPVADEKLATQAQLLHVLPPVAALIEMLVLIVVPALLDRHWEPFPTLSEFHPHFFWLPILLISLQYGTVSGLMSAGLAIALSAYLGWPDQEIGENHFSYLLRVWTEPVLWLMAALVLGQFRMRQIEQKRDLALQVDELSSQRKALADYATNLRTRCDALEREIARRRHPSARSMLNALGGLHQRDAKQRLDTCLKVAFGNDCTIGIYALEARGLRLAHRHGSDLARTMPRDEYAAGDPLFKAVAIEGRSLSVLQASDEAALGHEGLVAVPILAATGNGEIIGMVKLELAEPAEVDSQTASRLAVLAHHAAPMMTPQARVAYAAVVPETKREGLPALSTRPRLWRHVRRTRGTEHGDGGARKSNLG